MNMWRQASLNPNQNTNPINKPKLSKGQLKELFVRIQNGKWSQPSSTRENPVKVDWQPMPLIEYEMPDFSIYNSPAYRAIKEAEQVQHSLLSIDPRLKETLTALAGTKGLREHLREVLLEQNPEKHPVETGLIEFSRKLRTLNGEAD